jgi:hypothetical protein
MTPPGWYTDPTGRHESRYWDSAHWTAQVADHGVSTVEALPVVPDYPPAGLRPALGTAAPAKVGFRAVAVAPWRAALLQFALFAFGAALAFEMFAEASLTTVVNDFNDTGHMPAESTMRWTSWVYHYTPMSITYGRSPWLLWLVMVIGLVLATNLVVSKSQALAKSHPLATRSRRVWLRTATAEKDRLRAALRQSGAAQSLLRARGRLTLMIGTGAAAVAAAAISAYTLISAETVFQSKKGSAFTGDLSLGVGPTVCLAASVLVIIALMAAWPMRHDQHVWVMPDGTLRPDQPTA